MAGRTPGQSAKSTMGLASSLARATYGAIIAYGKAKRVGSYLVPKEIGTSKKVHSPQGTSVNQSSMFNYTENEILFMEELRRIHMGTFKDAGKKVDKVVDKVENKAEEVVQEAKGEWVKDVVPFQKKYKKEIRLAVIGLGLILLGGLVLRNGGRSK